MTVWFDLWYYYDIIAYGVHMIYFLYCDINILELPDYTERLMIHEANLRQT
jgi:hypothetical protein